MDVSPAIHLSTVPTAPTFTLGSALRWLGHDCPDRRCSQPIDALPVSLWFLRRGHPLPTYPLQAVLVVDLTETGGPPARPPAHRRGQPVHPRRDNPGRCGEPVETRVRRDDCHGTGHPADRNDTISRGYITIARMTFSANGICSTTMDPQFTIITGPVMRR
jgi:hypothetical protein